MSSDSATNSPGQTSIVNNNIFNGGGSSVDVCSNEPQCSVVVKKLKCIVVNARSIVNKVNDIQIYASRLDPDIICITETWASSEITNAELSITGYEIKRNDREHRRGGGCLVYVKPNLNVVVEEGMTYTEGTETLWIKINAARELILLGVCYRSPTTAAINNDKLHALITKACTQYDSVVIVGDFNYRNINWELLQADAEGRPFLELTQELFLTQHVKEPTR